MCVCSDKCCTSLNLVKSKYGIWKMLHTVFQGFELFILQNRDIQSLLPLTVKQINEALVTSDDKSNFTIDGVDVQNVCFLETLSLNVSIRFVRVGRFLNLNYVQVTLVGLVCNRTGRVTDVTFLLDDGTGRIECNKW